MEYTIKLSDKRMYDALLEFLSSIGVKADTQGRVETKVRSFTAVRLKTKGFHFDRDSANER